MFDMRVGIALAIVAVSASCSQAPQAPTTPSASMEGVSAATGVDGSTLKFGPPALVSPVEGERVNDRKPMLMWANAVAKYGEAAAQYEVEVSSPTEVVYSTVVDQGPEFGVHILPFELEYDTTYSWRARARIGSDFGPWSAWQDFMAPAKPVAQVSFDGGGAVVCAAPLSPAGPGELRRPRPNDSAIVQQVAAAFPGALQNSCQEHGGTWEFMDRVVDALRTKDGRYGYNAKRGNMNDPSKDVVSYFYRPEVDVDINNRHEVYIFDIVGGHCGPNPFTVWFDVTDATHQGGTIGRTMYPRPGRNVTVSGPCS